MAVVGSVKDPGKALNLWFVPREGDGTLRRGDLPYELVNVTLQKDFHDDLRAQLTAEALRVAAPIASTEIRGRVLEKGLNDVTEKIAALLEGGAVESPRRADRFEKGFVRHFMALLSGAQHPGLIGHTMLHSTRVAIFFFGRDRVA